MSMIQNGLSGLKAAELLLNNTSNNIANVNTPGYTRQQGVLTAVNAGANALNPGNGVEVSHLRRVSSEYAESALWRAQGEASYYNQMNEMFGQIEGIVSGEGLSIAEGLDTLFAAFNSAAADPQLTATRQKIIASADNMAERFNQLNVNLNLQKTQLTDQARYMVQGLNEQLSTFATLNKQIVRGEAEGSNTSQLRDQRNVVLQDIADKVRVNAQRNSDGRIDLSLENGAPLVLGDRASKFTLTGSDLSVDLGGQNFEIGNAGSRLGALIEFRDTKLADIQASLDSQAAFLADEINNQLMAGYDLNSNPGQPLFQYDPVDPTGTIEVTNISTDELAFIGDNAGAPAGGPGDSSNLLKIIDLNQGFYDNYTEMVSDVAIETNRASTESRANTSLLEAAQARRDGISGVNQDEEAMDLVAFSKAYQANAKVISTADELFNTLMGMFR